MGITKFHVLLLFVSIATCAWSHHHHGYYPEYRKENGHVFVEREPAVDSERPTDTVRSELLERNENHAEAPDGKRSIPFSERRLEKMLEKAILKIIMGDLGTADMLLLKSLNYSLEQVLTIREREFSKRKDDELRNAEMKSNGNRYYGDNLYEIKSKHWRHNTAELDSTARNDVEMSKNERKKNRYKERASYEENFDFDAYNRQAVIDYENLASKYEQQQLWSESATFDYEEEPRNSKEREVSHNLHQNFDRAMEPHVIFKIRYDDSEFDSSSNSDEKLQSRDALATKDLKHHAASTLRHTIAKNNANSFHASSVPLSSSSSSSAAFPATAHTPLPVVYQLGNFRGVKPDYHKSQPFYDTMESPEVSDTVTSNDTSNVTSDTPTDLNNSTDDADSSTQDVDDAPRKKVSEYEGLEWVEDDVYRVIPAFADSLNYEETDNENEASDYEEQNLGATSEVGENDTLEYQNDNPDLVKLIIANNNGSIENTSLSNLSTYQQKARAHRLEGNVTSSFDSQGQKAIEEIKTKVLTYTGRFNVSTNNNQVQRERLTMFSPTCQIPRNTDAEAWTDPHSMNLHFQLNLTSGDHVTAAKLRIYKLPQENVTTSSDNFDEDEDDEKKIRISVYYYTKPLKKHRSKKRLLDSVVTPLKAQGTPLVLEVKQGLRFWRLSPRNVHGNSSNHGLVIQVEDLDSRPLKPAEYIQQPTCADHDSDQKAFEPTLPALFLRTCHRYVRVVNNVKNVYVDCKH